MAAKDRCIYYNSKTACSMDNAAALFKGTFLYLLYQRQQIPMPFETMDFVVQQQLRETVDGDANFFVTKHRQLAADTIVNIKEIIKEMDQLLLEKRLSWDLQHIAIIFGNTIFSAKEIFLLTLDSNTANTEGGPTANAASIRNAVNQTILELISDKHFSESTSRSLALTNIYVIVHLPSSSLSDLDSDKWEQIDVQLSRSCKPFHINLTATANRETNESVPPQSEFNIFRDDELEILEMTQKLTIAEVRDEIVIESSPIKYDIDEILASNNWYKLSQPLKGFSDVLRNGQKIWHR